MGIAYEFGEGVPRSRARAIALIRQSGEANDIATILALPRTPARFADEDASRNTWPAFETLSLRHRGRGRVLPGEEERAERTISEESTNGRKRIGEPMKPGIAATTRPRKLFEKACIKWDAFSAGKPVIEELWAGTFVAGARHVKLISESRRKNDNLN